MREVGDKLKRDSILKILKIIELKSENDILIDDINLALNKLKCFKYYCRGVSVNNERYFTKLIYKLISSSIAFFYFLGSNKEQIAIGVAVNVISQNIIAIMDKHKVNEIEINNQKVKKEQVPTVINNIYINNNYNIKNEFKTCCIFR